MSRIHLAPRPSGPETQGDRATQRSPADRRSDLQSGSLAVHLWSPRGSPTPLCTLQPLYALGSTQSHSIPFVRPAQVQVLPVLNNAATQRLRLRFHFRTVVRSSRSASQPLQTTFCRERSCCQFYLAHLPVCFAFFRPFVWLGACVTAFSVCHFSAFYAFCRR